MMPSVMPRKSKDREVRFTLRLTKQLREAVQRCADKDRRTMSDWIVITLEDAVEKIEGSGSAKPVLKQR